MLKTQRIQPLGFRRNLVTFGWVAVRIQPYPVLAGHRVGRVQAEMANPWLSSIHKHMSRHHSSTIFAGNLSAQTFLQHNNLCYDKPVTS
jgi:hypothetical protein